MPPRAVKPANGKKSSNFAKSSGRGGRAAVGTASGRQQSFNQEEVTMSATELAAMKAELEGLRKAARAEAKKVAQAKCNIGEVFSHIAVTYLRIIRVNGRA